MKVSRITKIGIVLGITTLFAATMFTPSLSTSIQKTMDVKNPVNTSAKKVVQATERFSLDDLTAQTDDLSEQSIFLDTYYVNEEETETALLADEQNDAGYNTDTGDKPSRALPLYPGEVIDNGPGRGRTGSLNPDDGDSEDWYMISVCQGQTIQASVTSAGNYGFAIANTNAEPQGASLTATETGLYFFTIFAHEGAGEADYTFTLTLNGQNDAGTNGDAGNTITDVVSLTPGSYSGYLDKNDPEDWYSFPVTTGQGIFISLDSPYKSDVDVHLYNPAGVMVTEGVRYEDDEVEYPADVSGTWKIQMDLFPGWDATKWPEDYYLYGSGAYEFELTLGGTAQAPPGPVPQPQIIPVAQTFMVPNDPSSNLDEYAYLAAVPAANYIQDGTRYVSPIVYTGDTTPTHWFGDVDDTTQYFLDDWNTYLGRHGMTATVYQLQGDPIKVAADIATQKWASSQNAVLVVEGNDFQDEVKTVVDRSSALKINTNTVSAPRGSSELQDISGKQALPMFLDSKWGSMTVYAPGTNAQAVGIITPRYESATWEDWPHPYDGPGDNMNVYFPIALPGMYFPYVDSSSGDWTLQVTTYQGDRYKIPVTTTDSSIKVTVTTTEPSYLEVFLVDPNGNVRRPTMPSWNGGPINPLYVWNGGHWEGIGFEKWRRWEPTLSTEHTVGINYPMTGKWTAIVTPHYPYGQEQASDTINYQITAEVREHSKDRVSATLSAANAAVIASQKHIPLLYATEDTVPSETATALSKLGVKSIIFVNINNNGQNVKSALGTYTVTDLNTQQKVIDYIKADTYTENYITITSLASGDGYFAPAAMLAAYHGSPVLNIGEAADAYDFLDKATTWREYGGEWYHGTRAQGHLPSMGEPFDPLQFINDVLNGEFPSPGFDLELRWWSKVHDGVYNLIDGYGLDKEGKEAYVFVAPRNTDIRHPICMIMNGNNSYAGQIPLDTPGMDSALVCRDILYPALIYANPGRDVTTSQLMNFPDGHQWTTNDGERYTVVSTRELKQSFSSHGRFFEGHCLWDNWLERINTGASISYYSGHGTGGSGISAQFKNIEEQFPLAEPTHENLKDFTWWDGWRGYQYDDVQTKDPRWGGFTWYNPKEPNLYNIIHFKWADQLFENLHSEFEMWMSCTTAQHFGPEIYLEHGSALWYGNAGTGLCPQEDLMDDWMLEDLLNGVPAGEAFAEHIWLFQRDYTTQDPTAIYGSSSLQITNVQIILGDPALILYSPEWTEPTPVMP